MSSIQPCTNKSHGVQAHIKGSVAALQCIQETGLSLAPGSKRFPTVPTPTLGARAEPKSIINVYAGSGLKFATDVARDASDSKSAHAKMKKSAFSERLRGNILSALNVKGYIADAKNIEIVMRGNDERLQIKRESERRGRIYAIDARNKAGLPAPASWSLGDFSGMAAWEAGSN